MPVHDWTRVEAGIFHSFHNAWITHLGEALNGGLLPGGYYALGEQHFGHFVGDILTLHTSSVNGLPASAPLSDGGLALAEAPPKVRRQLTATETYRQRRRTLTVRHVSGHRLVALIEIVSPANKDRPESIDALAAKTFDALELGVNVLLIDLLPPGAHDPRGLHGVVWGQFEEGPYEPPAREPLTAASYAAGPPVRAFVEHLAAGASLPEMPLFLNPDRYVNIPLEPTYQAAYRGVPKFWCEVLEGSRTINR